MGAFIQDQIKVNGRFAITPGIRYDWQNFLSTAASASLRAHLSRGSSTRRSKTIVRGGGGIYYDRFGGGPLLDLDALTPAGAPRAPSFFHSIRQPCHRQAAFPSQTAFRLTAQPPALVQLEPNAKIPYQIHYGLSVERQLGRACHGHCQRLLHARHRHVPLGRHQCAHPAIRLHTPSRPRLRPHPPDAARRILRGRRPRHLLSRQWNKYFTGFGRFTWAHYESNTGGINWFPQNQYDPEDEWSNSGYDRRQRMGIYAIFQQKSLLNLATGIFANTGSPWTEVTGADPYGDGLFNARPDGVGRNSRTGPGYVDLDLRWGHDFAITANKADEAPHLGFSASAFNVLNHVNGQGIDAVDTSPSYGQITSVAPPRRIQLAMRFDF